MSLSAETESEFVVAKGKGREFLLEVVECSRIRGGAQPHEYTKIH